MTGYRDIDVREYGRCGQTDQGPHSSPPPQLWLTCLHKIPEKHSECPRVLYRGPLPCLPSASPRPFDRPCPESVNITANILRQAMPAFGSSSVFAVHFEAESRKALKLERARASKSLRQPGLPWPPFCPSPELHNFATFGGGAMGGAAAAMHGPVGALTAPWRARLRPRPSWPPTSWLPGKER